VKIPSNNAGNVTEEQRGPQRRAGDILHQRKQVRGKAFASSMDQQLDGRGEGKGKGRGGEAERCDEGAVGVGRELLIGRLGHDPTRVDPGLGDVVNQHESMRNHGLVSRETLNPKIIVISQSLILADVLY
jgi:hypothetical protein